MYPKGSSVMFYKLYLDSHVVASLAEYDALAIVEWDIIVAHSSSFSRLYEAAFFSSEWFWVKGSTLSGTEFHQTATLTKMWHILGHLNGNAICKLHGGQPMFCQIIRSSTRSSNYTVTSVE